MRRAAVDANQAEIVKGTPASRRDRPAAPRVSQGARIWPWAWRGQSHDRGQDDAPSLRAARSDRRAIPVAFALGRSGLNRGKRG